MKTIFFIVRKCISSKIYISQTRRYATKILAVQWKRCCFHMIDSSVIRHIQLVNSKVNICLIFASFMDVQFGIPNQYYTEQNDTKPIYV